MILMVSDIVDYPRTHFAGAVEWTVGNLDFGRADIGVEGGVYSLPDRRALLSEAEVLEQHCD